ncbi:unnamed protein product [Danaus chrysippus]|uniref:(African queen) hypothetical protein n=1 Tax=Danaus chrysippus TaxID=151541 RepID=A0A8J2QFI8_9NEOP|nr:unnamed protein product [Danaus chrysippus]
MHFTRILCRVPVIKFRKGMGPSAASAPPPSSGGPAAAAAAPAQAQSSAPMSSAAISDIDLPLRYQRRPLSQEEIDHINGGGVESKVSSSQNVTPACAIKIPRSILVQYGKKSDVISFKILLQKIETGQNI